MERRRTTTIVTIGIRNRRQFNLAERTVFAGGRYFRSGSIIAARTKLLAAISTAISMQAAQPKTLLRFVCALFSRPYDTISVSLSLSLSLSLSVSFLSSSLPFLSFAPYSLSLPFSFILPHSDNDRLSLKFPGGCPRGADKAGIDRPMMGSSDKNHESRRYVRELRREGHPHRRILPAARNSVSQVHFANSWITY